MYKKILITGVSRPGGIGSELARKFAESGYEVYAHGSTKYDEAIGYNDAGKKGSMEKITKLRDSDLSTKEGVEKLIAELGKHGPVSHMILCHAYSTGCGMEDWTFEEINSHLMTNVTSSMLLIQAFRKHFEDTEGCITLFTSGQELGPMTDEIPYAVSKAAVANLTVQVSHVLGRMDVRVNAVNPGPTDTGYIEDPELYREIENRFNAKRWGTPSDVANLLLFLHSREGAWITGQVINSEGGFRR
ncbi:SDR family oxidoreductase [Salinicoccus roseus]|uniref:SDR family oxidoreductase n=1 Tax=Salinicoccus roseus TaxID=45670 RepID=A0ABT4YI14_9STAP|nr:SDR family oxidoreductase [Salinicoccus roseus]MDB0580468.1 SDR family oxidoreductase [Salinicoccus roseus]